MAQKPLNAGRPNHFGRREPRGGREFSGRKVRQGRIVLNTPLRRVVFAAGLAIAVVAAFILAYWA